MNVLCERNCISKDTKGKCAMEEISITCGGMCDQFKVAPEFEPFCEDIVAVYDKAGIPSIMHRFKRMTENELFGGKDKPHPMFVIGNEIQDELYISVYPNLIINGKAYSMPMQQPAVNVTQEEAEEACFSKGEGWHLLTAMERGFLANLSLKSETLPHGNTNYGKYHADENEKGECFDGYKILTGSGPATWNHDHTVFGVSDLCGNVWELCRGLRLMNGMLQVCKNNDAAMDIDLAEKSDNWIPLMVGNTPIRIDATEGGISFTTEEPDADSSGSRFEDVNFEFGITDEMRELALFDGESAAYIYADTEGDRLPICGGGWLDGSGAGVFNVSLNFPRSLSNHSVGFRSAYYRKL